MRTTLSWGLALVAVLAPLSSPGQTVRSTVRGWEQASHIIVPQCRGYPVVRGNPDLVWTEVKAHVEITGRTASTVLQFELANRGARPAEAVIVLPIPDGATVGGFDFSGVATEPSAELLPRNRARAVYRDIVAKLRDPALLEFAGQRLLKSSVFPVPARGVQSIRIRYEEILGGDGQRVDYTLLRSAALDAAVPWNITVDVNHDLASSAIYSPTHTLVHHPRDPVTRARHVSVIDPATPGAFQLSVLLEESGLAASLFAYPDPTVPSDDASGGYFLFMAAAPEQGSEVIPREVTLVIDRSGSMAGAKLDQAMCAAAEVLARLGDDERFNLITYSNTARCFAPAPVPVSTGRAAALEWIRGVQPAGGTNISDALFEALRQPHDERFVPIVLFLTDGLPTLGRRQEGEIHELVRLANRHDRRIYTFGVGVDVNAPLLDRLSADTRAVSTYVLPGARVDTAVAALARRLHGPVLRNAVIRTLDAQGRESTQLLSELLPHRLPDLYAGEQLVVLGQYHRSAPLTIQVHGDAATGRRVFSYPLELHRASTTNAFVPRLWASRRIAQLTEVIRQSGVATTTVGPDRELVDEILRLSTRYGILTEYTAFLAQEGTDLSNWSAVNDLCSANYSLRAIQTRSGLGAVNQGCNYNDMRSQLQLNLRNGYWGSTLERVEHDRVQQIADGAFLRRGEQWLDTRAFGGSTAVSIDETVEFASPRYFELLDRMVEEHRQAAMSLRGRTVIRVDGRNVLLQQGKQDGC
ncbi:MAG: VWA domain-containing protein [Planctomycetes bacterium]|nr:VWA domain-containing protein [Planctomycetota bacterium]